MASWGIRLKCHLDPLFIVEKKIIILITFSCYDASSHILFTNLIVLSLYNLVHNPISFMIYKLVIGLLSDVKNELFTTIDYIHDHFTRQFIFFHINLGRSNIYARSFGNTSPLYRY